MKTLWFCLLKVILENGKPHGSQRATNYEQVKGQLTHL